MGKIILIILLSIGGWQVDWQVGDLNGDGQVGIEDFAILSNYYGHPYGVMSRDELTMECIRLKEKNKVLAKDLADCKRAIMEIYEDISDPNYPGRL